MAGGKTIAAAVAASVNIRLARMALSSPDENYGILPHLRCGWRSALLTYAVIAHVQQTKRGEYRHVHTLLFGDFRTGDRPCARHRAGACGGWDRDEGAALCGVPWRQRRSHRFQDHS